MINTVTIRYAAGSQTLVVKCDIEPTIHLDLKNDCTYI